MFQNNNLVLQVLLVDKQVMQKKCICLCLSDGATPFEKICICIYICQCFTLIFDIVSDFNGVQKLFSSFLECFLPDSVVSFQTTA